MTDASPVFGRRGARPATVWADRMGFPPDRVALCDSDGDDDPATLARCTASAPGLRPPAIEPITEGALTRRWPLRYLVRPQLLSRR
jgi:hypothetical protein